jgi:hypothetical protein
LYRDCHRAAGALYVLYHHDCICAFGNGRSRHDFERMSGRQALGLAFAGPQLT